MRRTISSQRSPRVIVTPPFSCCASVPPAAPEHAAGHDLPQWSLSSRDVVDSRCIPPTMRNARGDRSPKSARTDRYPGGQRWTTSSGRWRTVRRCAISSTPTPVTSTGVRPGPWHRCSPPTAAWCRACTTRPTTPPSCAAAGTRSPGPSTPVSPAISPPPTSWADRWSSSTATVPPVTPSAWPTTSTRGPGPAGCSSWPCATPHVRPAVRRLGLRRAPVVARLA